MRTRCPSRQEPRVAPRAAQPPVQPAGPAAPDPTGERPPPPAHQPRDRSRPRARACYERQLSRPGRCARSAGPRLSEARCSASDNMMLCGPDACLCVGVCWWCRLSMSCAAGGADSAQGVEVRMYIVAPSRAARGDSGTSALCRWQLFLFCLPTFSQTKRAQKSGQTKETSLPMQV